MNIKPITGAVRPDGWAPIRTREHARTVNGARARSRCARIATAKRYHLWRGHGRTDGPTRVAGTLFGNRAPRLVDIFGVPVEAELTGQMIYIVNTDEPGFIGALGTALGEAQVNIATFNLGRRETGGEAVALVSVDDPITPQLAKELCGLPGVREVVPLSF